MLAFTRLPKSIAGCFIIFFIQLVDYTAEMSCSCEIPYAHVVKTTTPKKGHAMQLLTPTFAASTSTRSYLLRRSVNTQTFVN